jgi:hypothetical protein
MKNALKNILLWQKKRNELQVNDDPQADWGQMQSLLDEHMPVVKKPGGFKGFRTLPVILITFSAAAMIYVAGNIYNLEKRNHAAKDRHHKSNPARPGAHFADSLYKAAGTGNKMTDTGNLLSGSQDAADHSGGRPATNESNNPTAKFAPAGSTKQNNGPAVANKPGHGLNGLNRRPNPSPAAQQNTNLVKGAITNNKTGTNRGGLAHYHAGVMPSGNYGGNHNNTPGGNKPGRNQGQTTTAINSFDNNGLGQALAPAFQSPLRFDMNLNKIQPPALPVLNSRLNQAILQANNQAKGGKKGKPDKPQNNKPSKIDWGILMGVNASGSFTPKSQNANFYGSAPIDPWFGLFATYKLNGSWALSTGAHFFSPQNITTTYTHANQSKVDSGQSLTITATRKMYAVSIPVYAVYNAGNGLSFKAGPVINFPVKQINAGSVLLPYSVRTDTAYYKTISPILNATQYRQNINFGFSAGASYQVKRFIFEATYLKSLSGYGINSGLGAYKSYNGTFQFTIGFQLDKVKP